MNFDSLNPYENLEVIIEESPQALLLSLKKIRRPIKIVAIVAYGNRQAAYIMGDIRRDEIKKPKLRSNNNG